MKSLRRIAILLIFGLLSLGSNAQTTGGRITVIQNQSFSTEIFASPNVPIRTLAPLHGTAPSQAQPLGNNLYEISYTPDADYIGFDQVTYEVWTSPQSYNYVTYQFDVVKSIVKPKDDYSFRFLGGSALSIDVISNDYASNPPLTLKNISFQEGGTATINNGQIDFVPDADYTGFAQIRYTVCDSLGTCATGLFTTSVVDGYPESNSQLHLGTTKNTKVVIPMEYPHFLPTQEALHGTYEIAYTATDSMELIYTPDTDYVGEDYFVLALHPPISSGAPHTFLEVYLDVYDKSAPNTIAIDDQYFTPRNVPISFNVLDNDYGNYYVKGFSQPPSGTLVYMGGGNFTYTPETDHSGGVSFTYRVGNMFDPNIEAATVEIGIGNQAPSKGTFDLTTSMNTPLVIRYPVDFTEYAFELTNQADDGIVEIFEGQQTITVNGEEISGYNLMVYTPNDGFEGVDEFDFNYCVAENGECKEVKVNLDVIDAPSECVDGCVWPGDADHDGVISSKDILAIGRFFGETGPKRADTNTDWYAHQSTDWNNTKYSEELKYADTNGDGQITAEDTVAISQAYAKNSSLTPKIPATKKNIDIHFGTPSVLNPQPGDFVTIPLILGTPAHPAVDVYGFTYNIDYWVDAFDNVSITYNKESWLTRNDAVLSISKPPYNGRIESAITRTGKIAASGIGIIGLFNTIVDDEVDGWKLNDGKIDLRIDGGVVSNAQGQSFSINGSSTQLTLNLAGTGLTKIDEDQVILYPNPASEELNIHLNSGFKATDIEILDMQGRTILGINGLETNHYSLPLDTYTSGIYIAKVYTLDGVVLKKFNVTKDEF